LQPWKGEPCIMSTSGSPCSPGGSVPLARRSRCHPVGGDAAVTHFGTAHLFSSQLLLGAQVRGPARPQGSTPPCLGPREIPGALQHPPGVLAGLLAGVAVSHSASLRRERSSPGWGDPRVRKSPVAPITLGWVPAAREGWRCNPREGSAWATGCGLGCGKPSSVSSLRHRSLDARQP